MSVKAEQMPVCMGIDAMRLCMGIPPRNFSRDEVVRWIDAMQSVTAIRKAPAHG